MYNPDLKEKFILSKYASFQNRKRVTWLFDTLEELERKNNLDLCQFDVVQAQQALNLVCGVKNSYVDSILSIFRTYTRWCRANGQSGAGDAFEKISTPNIDIVRNRMISGPKELSAYLDNLFQNKPEELCADNVHRCYFWLAFMGVDWDDAFRLTESDIDLENMEVVYEGKRLEIYRESYSVFRNSVRLHAFTFKHPKYTTTRPRVPGNTILRSMKQNDDPTHKAFVNTMHNYITKAIKEGRVSKKLNYSSIQYSGYFYRAYELEKAGLGLNLRDVAKHNICGNHTYSEDVDEMKRRIDNQEESLKRDYLRWKLAFVTI